MNRATLLNNVHEDAEGMRAATGATWLRKP